jgi:hypothetical protein
MDITRAKELIAQHERIDAELVSIFTGGKERKPQRCGACGEEGHSARTCQKGATDAPESC